jgi:hypothetical protein
VAVAGGILTPTDYRCPTHYAFIDVTPTWRMSGTMPSGCVRRFGFARFFGYARTPRTRPRILPHGTRDEDRFLDVAIVGDRLGSAFGPRVTRVLHSSGSTRPVSRLCVVQTTGTSWTAVWLEDEPPEAFDEDVLDAAVRARLRPGTLAMQLLDTLRAGGVYRAGIEADLQRDPRRFGYDETARRCVEPLDSYIARLAESLAICRSCGLEESRHDAFPCNRPAIVRGAVSDAAAMRARAEPTGGQLALLV